MRVTDAPAGGALPNAAPRDDNARLRQAASQLTGVFAQQLFKAMRETVPQGEGAVDASAGQEMFTGLLDEHLAGAGPVRPGASSSTGAAEAAFTRGLADAVYKRLRARAGLAAATPAVDTPPNAPAAGAPATGAPATGAPATGALTTGSERVTPSAAPASLTQPHALPLAAARR